MSSSLPTIWEKSSNNYLIGYNIQHSSAIESKVALFDLDHTIIKPSNNRRFSKTDSDWEFYNDSIISKLEYLYKNNYTIIIISNQKGLTNEPKIKEWKSKINKVFEFINFPITIYASLKDDIFRKPRIGFLTNFIKHDPDKSFYCGDAGNILNERIIENIKIPMDHSDSDLKFAINANLTFVHRDNFCFDKIEDNFCFDKIEDNLSLNKSNILKYPISYPIIVEGKYKFRPIKNQELVLMVGFQGSGKSFYCKRYANKYNYEIISQDKIRTKNKCLDLCNSLLKNNKSVIIDNTNPSLKIREEYIQIGKKNNVIIRCFYMKTSVELSKHNNIFRSIISDLVPVPSIAYNIYKKNFKTPTLNEGFDDVLEIDYVLYPKKIQADYIELYHQYLI